MPNTSVPVAAEGLPTDRASLFELEVPLRELRSIAFLLDEQAERVATFKDDPVDPIQIDALQYLTGDAYRKAAAVVGLFYKIHAARGGQ